MTENLNFTKVRGESLEFFYIVFTEIESVTAVFNFAKNYVID